MAWYSWIFGASPNPTVGNEENRHDNKPVEAQPANASPQDTPAATGTRTFTDNRRSGWAYGMSEDFSGTLGATPSGKSEIGGYGFHPCCGNHGGPIKGDTDSGLGGDAYGHGLATQAAPFTSLGDDQFGHSGNTAMSVDAMADAQAGHGSPGMIIPGSENAVSMRDNYSERKLKRWS